MFDRWLTKKKVAVLIAPVLAGGAVWVGTAVGAGSSPQGTASATTEPAGPPCSSIAAPAGAYPTNQSGQTYGPSAQGCPSQDPDLIRAVGPSTSGTGSVVGYVLKSQLESAEGADVNSPEQAAAWTQAHGGQSTTIPLYAQDGTTIIGHFTVGG